MCPFEKQKTPARRPALTNRVFSASGQGKDVSKQHDGAEVKHRDDR
jgi:hypothetical protein